MGSRRAVTGCDFLLRREPELVIVRDFDFVCIALLPTKANTILVVDSNAVLTSAAPTKPLKTVAGRYRKFHKVTNPIELVELAASNRPQYSRARRACRSRFAAVEDIPSPTIRERAYHAQIVTA